MDILSSVLSQDVSQASDKQSEFERVLWFTQVMKWLQRPRSTEEKQAKLETVYTVRLKYLLLLLSKNPKWKENFISTMGLLLAKISSPLQLVRAGLPETSSFVQEFVFRIQEKILPKPQLSEDLSTLMTEIFPSEDESLYIDFIDVEVLKTLFKFFETNVELHLKLRQDLMLACYLLSHQIHSHSLVIASEVSPNSFNITQTAEFKLEGLLRQPQASFQVALECLDSIEAHLAQLHRTMQLSGVKIELVYLFQIQKRKINRLRILLQFLVSSYSIEVNFRLFVSHLVLDTQHQNSLRSFFSENLTLITERIVQTNSHIGEHYVTFTKNEFKKMFKSALGGGAITAYTVFAKHALSQLKLVGFIKGFFDGLNYSSSFLAIQLMGWTLATKQPSATAPFIAAALQKSTTESRRSIVALLRTQFIAVVGNVSMVFPICFTVAWLSLKFGYATHTISESLQTIAATNILGPTPLYAAFTGCLLFASSLMAGWFENWVRVYRVDKRIKYNDKIQRLIGVKLTERFAQFVADKANPMAANISLGFLLGLAPPILKFLGFPLDVRHVTLATGAFAAALPSVLQDVGINHWQIINAVGGIFVVGVVNISVSFALAFLLASISLQVKFSAFWRLFKWGVALMFTRPWLLFVPEEIFDTKSEKSEVEK